MAVSPNAGLVEDDDELRDVVKRALERAGMTVRATASGAEAVGMFADEPPDVLVLDIALPDADGRDVCQALRGRGMAAPVLFLTARDALPDRLSGFHAGGDDYLTKPFALAELLVRIDALLRRTPDAPDVLSEEPAQILLDPATHGLRWRDRHVPLTPTEFRLVGALAAKPGQVVRRSALISAAWPQGAIVHDNTLDAYVARIRRKLREIDSPVVLDTARGVGYVMR